MISKIPEITDQMLSEYLFFVRILRPIKFPNFIKIICSVLINIGRKLLYMPATAEPATIPKLSNDRANPRTMASLLSISFELSKSELFVLRIIKMPSADKTKLPKMCARYTGINCFIIFPNIIDIEVIKTEMIKSIKLDKLDIFVFFIPYVIPIPSASILDESPIINV